MEDMSAIEQSDHFSLDEALQTDGALLLSLADLHLPYALHTTLSQA
jgi:hypothetical protein